MSVRDESVRDGAAEKAGSADHETSHGFASARVRIIVLSGAAATMSTRRVRSAAGSREAAEGA